MMNYTKNVYDLLDDQQFIPQAMSKNMRQYATDLEEIVQHCAWYLYDPFCIDQPNHDLLDFFIKGLSIDRENDYDESILQIRKILLLRMWKLAYCM